MRVPTCTTVSSGMALWSKPSLSQKCRSCDLNSLTVIVPYALSQEGAREAMLPTVIAFPASFRADLIGCACRTPTTR